MSTYKEQSLQAKAVRLGLKDARPLGNKNQRERPVLLEYRVVHGYWKIPEEQSRGPWQTGSRRYRTEDEAQLAMNNLNRKYRFREYRIKGKDST